MAELTQQMLQNGQELQTGDVNNLGLAALMDDRTFADVLRMLPNTAGVVSRLIMPYAVDDDHTNTTVQPSGSADGNVSIGPFRAVIGARTEASSNGLDGWRDIRSGVFVAGGGVWSAVPPTGLAVAQGFTANASGNARWDLVYAAIVPDGDQSSENRAVKSATLGTVTTGPTVVQLSCVVTIGVVTGTPSATPALPTIPSDSGGVYYIPLAYVLIPDGFGASSTIKTWHIMPIAPTPIALSKGLGGSNAMPANQQNLPTGSVVTATQAAAWANNSTSSISARPQAFMPSDMIGKETLFIAINVPTTSSSNWSHLNSGLVDSSRDWRNRVFKATIFAQLVGTATWAWGRSTSQVNTNLIPDWAHLNSTPETPAGNIVTQFGQSFVQTAANLPGTPPSVGYTVCFVEGTTTLPGQLTGGVGLYIDPSGLMRVYINGVSNNTQVFFWVEATRGFGNY